MRRVLAGVAAVLLLGIGALGAAAYLALQPASPSAAEIVVEIPRGSALRAVAAKLEAAGVIRSARAFALLARLQGRADALRAGEYALAPSLDAREVLDRLAAGARDDPPRGAARGPRMEEIAVRIEAAGLGSAADFLAVARDPASAAAFGVEGASLEGYLFPETYELARGGPRRHRPHDGRPLPLGVAAHRDLRTRARPLDARGGRAGLADREGDRRARGAPADRGGVPEPARARHAARDRSGGDLRHCRLRRQPPAHPPPGREQPLQHLSACGPAAGPIANPGAAALRAVVEPATADYLYFVARKDGTHQFSRSYAEHVRAVNRFQRNSR